VSQLSLLEYAPIECKAVTRNHFDRVQSLDVAHDIASQIDRTQVFDWSIVVPALARGAVVSRDADTFEGTLIYAIDIDTLLSISWMQVAEREITNAPR
jgi:hypothetical protein